MVRFLPIYNFEFIILDTILGTIRKILRSSVLQDFFLSFSFFCRVRVVGCGGSCGGDVFLSNIRIKSYDRIFMNLSIWVYNDAKNTCWSCWIWTRILSSFSRGPWLVSSLARLFQTPKTSPGWGLHFRGTSWLVLFPVPGLISRIVKRKS